MNDEVRLHAQCHEFLEEVLNEFEKVEEENERLRRKTRAQRAELRRLNDAMLRKNARVSNSEMRLQIALAVAEQLQELSGIRVTKIESRGGVDAEVVVPALAELEMDFAGKLLD